MNIKFVITNITTQRSTKNLYDSIYTYINLIYNDNILPKYNILLYK